MCVDVHHAWVGAHAYTHLSLYFYSGRLLGKSAGIAFLGWWPYKSFESQLVFWTFEMLTARKPSHFWKKVCHKNWTLLKKEPDANGKYKCYPKMFYICILRIFLYLIATCGYISFPHVGVHFQEDDDWTVRNAKLINTLYSSFGSCRFSNGFICI